MALARAGFDANGWTEDAAGHGAPRVDIAAAGRGIERGTGGLVGEFLKLLLLRVGLAQAAGGSIAGKTAAVLVNPTSSPALDFGGQCWLVLPQNRHSRLQPGGVERIDGEGAVAALGASRPA